jgi:hypothetical protein
LKKKRPSPWRRSKLPKTKQLLLFSKWRKLRKIGKKYCKKKRTLRRKLIRLNLDLLKQTRKLRLLKRWLQRQKTRQVDGRKWHKRLKKQLLNRWLKMKQRLKQKKLKLLKSSQKLKKNMKKF